MVQQILVKLLHPANRWRLVVAYVAVDVFLVGLGMGVPIFCILFGFPMGWIVAWQSGSHRETCVARLRDLLVKAMVASSITVILMVGIWGQFVRLLFDGSPDYGVVGMPMILYEPKPSFVGWLVLMILVSPILQLLMTVFSGVLYFARHMHATAEGRVLP